MKEHSEKKQENKSEKPVVEENIPEENESNTSEAENSVDYEDKYKRLLAEYSNAMRQKEVELKAMAQFGSKNLLLKVVDILDDIEMGISQEGVGEEVKSILGILRSKVFHLLTLEGVTEINLIPGDSYDPEKAEVLSTVEDDEHKGKISYIARKGYMIGDRVLRTAKVIVGK